MLSVYYNQQGTVCFEKNYKIVLDYCNALPNDPVLHKQIILVERNILLPFFMSTNKRLGAQSPLRFMSDDNLKQIGEKFTELAFKHDMCPLYKEYIWLSYANFDFVEYNPMVIRTREDRQIEWMMRVYSKLYFGRIYRVGFNFHDEGGVLHRFVERAKKNKYIAWGCV